MVLLLLVGPQSVPPLPQDLADCSVILVGMPLVHQGPVALAEDHERVHRSADVVLLPLVEVLEGNINLSFMVRMYLSGRFDRPSLRCTDLPVPVLGQGAEGLRASLQGGSGGRGVVGHARGEPAPTPQRKR